MANTSDIYDELRELSPALLDLKRSVRQPDVPAGYFDKVADSVISRLEGSPEAILSGIDRGRKPAVPEAYFDSLADQVMGQIREQEKEIRQAEPEPERKGILILYFRQLAVAASVLGIIALGVLIFDRQTISMKDCEDGIACLTREEIREYVSEHADEFEAEAIHEAFQPEIDPGALSSPVAEEETTATPALNEEQIEKYIEENPAVIDLEDPATDIF